MMTTLKPISCPPFMDFMLVSSAPLQFPWSLCAGFANATPNRHKIESIRPIFTRTSFTSTPSLMSYVPYNCDVCRGVGSVKEVLHTLSWTYETYVCRRLFMGVVLSFQLIGIPVWQKYSTMGLTGVLGLQCHYIFYPSFRVRSSQDKAR